jgi:hypothetical protein
MRGADLPDARVPGGGVEPSEKPGRAAIDIDDAALDKVRPGRRGIGHQTADFRWLSDSGGAMRGYQERQGIVPADTVIAYRALYIACKMVGLDQTGIDRIVPNALPYSDIGHCFGKFSEATLTDPPMVNAAESAREPMPTILTMLPLA